MSSPVISIRYRVAPRLAGAAISRARLSVVPRRRTQRAKLPFVVLVSFVLLAGVIGLLLFNTSMQQAAFTATTLEQRAATLDARKQTLQMELDQLRDPQRVAMAAQGLGYVLPGAPAFLRLSDGKVLGMPAPATRQDPLRLEPKLPAKPAAIDPKPNVVIVPAANQGGDTATGSGRVGHRAGRNNTHNDRNR